MKTQTQTLHTVIKTARTFKPGRMKNVWSGKARKMILNSGLSKPLQNSAIRECNRLIFGE